MATHNEKSLADALTECISNILSAAENVISADRAGARDDSDIKALERAALSARALLAASAAEPPAAASHETDREAEVRAAAVSRVATHRCNARSGDVIRCASCRGN
ncbi:hypothetical protein G3N57_06420 [Paraburkholderia sp. Se-20369]|nr:hypothetical protein [Paraburkholderia sp. Se-20369]